MTESLDDPRPHPASDIARLEHSLGVAFHDRSLLELALLHSSRSNEAPDHPAENNQRLEFLGDAVLGLVIAESLYKQWPGAEEGTLTGARSALVRKESLAGIARELRLGMYLRMGHGEAATGGGRKEKNLADALEAVIAAIYLDQGYTAARTFVLRHLQPEFQSARREGIDQNSKSLLQQLLQASGQPLPRYRLVNAVGPDHDKEFTSEVYIQDTILGCGTGRSRKAAETAAASSALARLQAKEE